MKKTVLSAVALAVAFGAGISAAQAETRIGVTIYKYDDNFMSLMPPAKKFKKTQIN